MKKAVIFNGSTRYDGNNSTIIKYIERGLREHNADVKTYNLFTMKMSACRGCFSCRLDDKGKCAIDDELSKAIAELQDADIVVIATPIFFMHMNGMTKNLYDRLFPIVTNDFQPRYGAKKAVTIYTQANEDPHMYDSYFDYVSQCILPCYGFVDEHRIVCPNAVNPQSAEDSRELTVEAYELGRKLAME